MRTKRAVGDCSMFVLLGLFRKWEAAYGREKGMSRNALSASRSPLTHSARSTRVDKWRGIRPSVAARVNLVVSAIILGAPFVFMTNCLAAIPAVAQVNVQCTGLKGSSVAIRWGQPTYNSTALMPMLKATCDVPTSAMQTVTQNLFVTQPQSQLEIQTEGGIQTAYVVDVKMDGKSVSLGNTYHVVHTGSPSVMNLGNGFNLVRSAGPNKYGEQNFRVALTSGTTAPITIQAQSSGSSKAQVALRWGHPDFNDHGYIGTWTVKPGPVQTKSFMLNAAKSEFEIQTEGGTSTGYGISIWVGSESMNNTPSIQITQTGTTTTATQPLLTDATFTRSKGNVYGEMDIRVNAPFLATTSTPTGGLTIAYDFGALDPSVNSNLTFSVSGTTASSNSSPAHASSIASTGAAGSTSFTQTVTEVVNAGLDNRYTFTASNLAPGTWTITVSPLEGGRSVKPTVCTVMIGANTSPTLSMNNMTGTCSAS